MDKFECGTLALSLALLMLVHPAASAAGGTMEFIGMCDASAAVPIGDRHFVVADDEDNVLRVYEWGRTDPVSWQNLDSYLKLEEGGKHPEADIEGAAVIRKHVFWIASHGASSGGKPRPNRRWLFATTVGMDKGKPTIAGYGTPFPDFLMTISNDPRYTKYDLKNRANNAPESDDGLNIEGLAATPTNGLLVGFRNPVVGGNALLAEIENPEAVITKGAAPRIGDPLELPLAGLGIRSIDYVGTMKSYLIVAGPPGKGEEFKVFIWSGQGGRVPVEVSPQIKIPPGITPEAMFYRAGENKLFLFSDDGGRLFDGIECKELKNANQRRFRVIAVSLQ